MSFLFDGRVFTFLVASFLIDFKLVFFNLPPEVYEEY
jgi:hypothetical protein